MLNKEQQYSQHPIDNQAPATTNSIGMYSNESEQQYSQHPIGNQAPATTNSIGMYSNESEQALIGSLLIDPSQIPEITQVLKTDYFYIPSHQAIFGAMVEMSIRDLVMDPVTVAEFAGMGRGQAEYLFQLASNTFNHSNALAYAKVVSRHKRRRDTQLAAKQIQEAALDKDIKEEELVSMVQGIALKMDAEGGVSRPQPKTIADAMPDYLTLLEERMESDGRILGVSTGLIDLDSLMHGMNPGELIIVAGRPGMGKTTLALNFCNNEANRLLNESIAQARKQGKDPLIEKNPKLDFDGHVQVFSLEMPVNQLMDRLVSSNANIDMSKVIRGTVDETEMDAIFNCMTRIRLMPLVMDDSSKLTPSSLRLRSRAIAAKMGSQPRLIMVDYLQLMESASNSKGGNRTQEISDISRGLKLLAREMNCPVVALSQLNRSLEQRVNKRPLMSDLRESGSIEQDSDVIIFTYRDEVYNEDTEFKGIAELIVAKQRQGSTGTVRAKFEGKTVRFLNLTAGHYDANEERIY